MIDLLLHAAKINYSTILRLVSDIPADKVCHQPHGLINHPGWQVGHLTFVRASVCELIGKPGPYSSAELGMYGPGSTPNADAATHAPLEKLIAQLKTAQAHLETTLASLDPKVLENPNPITQIAERLPTVKHLVLFLVTTHEGWHIGQLCDYRRVAGLPKAL